MKALKKSSTFTAWIPKQRLLGPEKSQESEEVRLPIVPFEG